MFALEIIQTLPLEGYSAKEKNTQKQRVEKSREVGEMGGSWERGTKLQFYWTKKSRELIYSMLTTVNNNVLNSGVWYE